MLMLTVLFAAALLTYAVMMLIFTYFIHSGQRGIKRICVPLRKYLRRR
jgi:hypothetical protein